MCNCHLLQTIVANFNSWRQLSNHKAAMRRKLSKGLSALSKHAQRVAWNAWHDHIKDCIGKREVIRHIVAHFRDTSLAKVSQRA